MDLKSKRHQFLTGLLNRSDFRRQEEVVHAMLAKGFDVTQSSISRDFRELGVIKMAGIYRTPQAQSSSPFGALVLKVESAGPNLLVVHTEPGAASAVAERIDVKSIAGIVGTVAGDNTIFIATKSAAAQSKALRQIESI